VRERGGEGAIIFPPIEGEVYGRLEILQRCAEGQLAD